MTTLFKSIFIVPFIVLWYNFTNLFIDHCLSSELLITGSDSIAIELGDDKPVFVEVWFKDEVILVPCNPQHCDCLEYTVEITHHHHEMNCDDSFVLEIRWNVSGARKIGWKVIY